MFTQHFGRIVRDKRERKHLTVARAAELADLSGPGLTMIEFGDSDPKLSSILRLAVVLDIDLGDLNTCKPEELTETILTV